MAVKWNQMLLAVDENDNFIRYAPRKDCHTGKGIRHRAITILIYNKKKQVLLQKRKHDVFDNIWDMAGATHPLHTENGDETYEKSGQRCLLDEWGIRANLERIFAFNYYANYGELCENEYCMLLAAQYDGKLKPNKSHCYDYKWISWNNLIKEFKSNPENLSPWLIAAIEKLIGHAFLEKLKS